MAIYRLTHEAIVPLEEASFVGLGVKERQDLQRFLKIKIDVVAPGVLVIAEEFCDWGDSKRRVDLLGIDDKGSLVVFELKRSDDGGHMELQAIRYAAMVSRMTFAKAVGAYQTHLDAAGAGQDARAQLLDFLNTSEPPRDEDTLPVRIVLVSADFAKELTTAVLWLNEWEIDIRCVRVKPYWDGQSVMLDVQQVVPLPEASEYQVTLTQGAASRREAFREAGEFTGYYFMNVGQHGGNDARAWEDCRKYEFLSAGGNETYQGYVKNRQVGDKVFAYLSGHGYVGLGEVVGAPVPYRDFVPVGQTKLLRELPTTATKRPEQYNDLSRCDWCVPVRWIKAVGRDEAVLQTRFRRQTFQPIKQQDLVDQLIRALGVSEEPA
jgi:hypothetical protein